WSAATAGSPINCTLSCSEPADLAARAEPPDCARQRARIQRLLGAQPLAEHIYTGSAAAGDAENGCVTADRSQVSVQAQVVELRHGHEQVCLRQQYQVGGAKQRWLALRPIVAIRDRQQRDV